MDLLSFLKALIALDTTDSRNGEAVVELFQRLPHGKVEVVEREGVKNLLLYSKAAVDSPKVFVLNGHYDTVPPGEGWSRDPFGAEVEGQLLYGRGASDMKGPLAAMALSFSNLQHLPVVLMVVGDEEKGGERGTKPALQALLREKEVVGALVGEPTQEGFGKEVRVGRRGVLWLNVSIEGRAGHASTPHKALHPLSAVAALRESLQGLPYQPPLPPTTVSITSLHMDGGAVNRIPGRASLTLDIRLNSATKPEEVERRIRLLEGMGYRVGVERLMHAQPFHSEGPLSKALLRELYRAGYAPKPSTSGGSSDARFFHAEGVDVAEVGPKAVNIHGPDEAVSLKELEEMAEFLTSFLPVFLKEVG